MAFAPRVTSAILAGKAAGAFSRALRRGGGTALPGLLAERVDPQLVARLGGQLGRGSALITGTNGKTTTARIAAAALRAAGVPFVHNREGSNLMRGIAGALMGVTSAGGRVRRGRELCGLFEVDEATLPHAARALQPRAMVFTNLFRDQLDRYGEVDTVAAMWREALAAAPQDATLILNADDPSVAELALDWRGPLHWFGLDDEALAGGPTGAFDARWCRVCGGSFEYERRYFAHVGYWRCAGCGRQRAEPQTVAREVRLGLDGARFEVPGLGEVSMPLTGLYNVYNALAAVALGRVLELPDEAIVRALGSVQAAFGRQEAVELEGRRLRLLLTKNPAGANQVLRLLAGLEGPLQVAGLLNDRHADGRDVSWIWDVDYEVLAGRVVRCWAGGDRAEDLALRLKYAGWPSPAAREHDPARLVDAILAGSERGSDVFVIPTYTAMLELRRELVRRGAASDYWR
jgi:UDP-N-acetylmuramyl tripeptide synthase